MSSLRYIALMILTVSLSLIGNAAPKRSVGFATANVPFEVNGSKVDRNATVLEGETLKSSEFAAALNLSQGSKFILGIDSQVRVYERRVVLEKGSVRLASTGRLMPALQAEGLKVVPQDDSSTLTLYMSEDRVVSVSVGSGSASVFTESGKKISELAEGESVSFTGSHGDAERAPVEIAKVQAKQLKTLRKAHKSVPGFGRKATTWLAALAAASGGAIAAGSGAEAVSLDGAGAASADAIDVPRLHQATADVGREIFSSSLEEEGCGNGCPPNDLITNNYEYCFVIFGFSCL